jgi:hypothetical protein
MRRSNIGYAFILVFILCIHSAVAQEILKNKYYPTDIGFLQFGIATSPLNTTGFRDFQISDWQTYGLMSDNPINKEGRFHIPLSKYQYRGMSWGGFLNFGGVINQYWEAGFDIQVTNKQDIMQMITGLSAVFYPYYNNRWRIGFLSRLAYGVQDVTVTDAYPLPGYNPTVRTENGFNLKNGDKLRIATHSAIVQFGIKPEFALSNKWSVFALIGYNLQPLVSNMQITNAADDDKDNNNSLKPGDAALLRSIEEGTTTSNINARTLSTGFFVNFGFTFRFKYEKTTYKKCDCCYSYIEDTRYIRTPDIKKLRETKPNEPKPLRNTVPKN